MGTKVRVEKFCDQKFVADPYYIRAVVDKSSEKVICKSAKRVHIKYQCEGKADQYCKDKEIGCYLFQEKLAKRLKLTHSSLMKHGSQKRTLNCHFTPKYGKNELYLNSK